MDSVPPDTQPRLSICIPTHDGRAFVLDRALRGVVEQLTGDTQRRVQVCISDNGSRDGTQEVIERHRPALAGRLVEHRYEDNLGFTTNLLKVVELASGDFCWLLGSDDEIADGAIAAVLEILDRNPDLCGITLNRLNVNDLQPQIVWGDDPRVLPPAGTALMTSAEQIFAELAMLQDYISTQIVYRDAWLAATRELGPAGIAAAGIFPHIAILGAMIKRTPRWWWHGEQLIIHRLGVEALDAPYGRDLVDYTLKVTAERSRIWGDMFGKRSPVYKTAMRRIWRVQVHALAVAHLKLQAGQSLRSDLRLLTGLVRFYWILPEFWLRSFPVLLAPHQAIRLAGQVVLRVRRIRAALAG